MFLARTMEIDHSSGRERATLDRISNLPKEVIDEILTRIPMRDAVRTSMLSRNWRYKWTCMPELVFDNLSVSATTGTQNDSDLVNAVNHVLFLHNGVVSKFRVNFAEKGCFDVDRWILVLTRKKLNDLTLRFGEENAYRLPGCLFSCQTLRMLKLKGCILILPPLFQNLRFLSRLVLDHVDISNETFENLLTKLPLLSILVVLLCYSLTHINVRAPNLVVMIFHGTCHCINFLHTPKLIEIGICLWFPGSPTIMLDGILKNLVDVNKISFFEPIIECSPSHVAPRRFNITYRNLKFVRLDISFEDTRQLLGMLCLCRSSPYLEKLFIHALYGVQSMVAEDFWEGQLCKEGDIFCHLKRVKLKAFEGVPNAVGTVQFILLNAVILKSIRIEWRKSVQMDRELSLLLEKMMRFKRASSEAEVLFSGL